MCVLRYVVIASQIEKFAGHAQMDGEDAIRIKLDQNELATTRDSGNTEILEFALEGCS